MPSAENTSPSSSDCARASARSAVSIARSQALSSSAPRSSPGTNSASNGKEHRLPVALQADVEAERAVVLLRIRELDARELMLQQSAREHVCLDVCGVRRDDEREAALDVRSAAAPTPARRDGDLDHAVYHRLVPARQQATDEAGPPRRQARFPP